MKAQPTVRCLGSGRRRPLLLALLVVAYVGGVFLLQPRADHGMVARASDAGCTLTITQVFDQAIATSKSCDRSSLRHSR